MKTHPVSRGLVLGILVLAGLSAGGQEKPISLVETGINHYKAGRYKESLDVLKEVIRTSINDKEVFLAYLYSSYTYFSLPVQELENAKINAERAVEVNPDYNLRTEEFATEFIEFFKHTKEELTGIAYFNADPNPASIFLDDKSIGESPMKRELLAKVYLLRVVKSGYTPFETEIEIKKTEVINFQIPLNDGKNWKTFLKSSVIFIALSFLMKSI